MRLILAILLPFVVFFTINRPFQGIFCLLLQITILGWIPAAIWAVYALGNIRPTRRSGICSAPDEHHQYG
ncbi:Proteolipid membrane potential modulator [Pseudovibrio sp. W64]|uniref:YqaE/Pmp3 family membrane protein n=1 Tax=Pseudovibrio sp. W64 TaxID=1735583 RepID=UPI0007B2D7EA|nr:YqaE/Pmp3 family membrane protein [Pseudovibrio sp. W64]KZK81502.1 Proteolipid membrane potential modulator [Pseudovibrio sp. W64]